MSSTGGQDFVVAVKGAVGSEQEWKQALAAEASGKATDPGTQAEERLRARGRTLGEKVQEILLGLGDQYRLLAVIWEGFRARWLVRIQSPRGVSEIPIPAEVADGVVESEGMDDTERLKNLVLFGAGRQDLIFKRNA
ncbi:MAG TPA: hypothetical protein VEG30_02850 [Terriglobales bacterium]|nr:hypothetical protein [Terriglobales bacterium]